MKYAEEQASTMPLDAARSLVAGDIKGNETQEK